MLDHVFKLGTGHKQGESKSKSAKGLAHHRRCVVRLQVQYIYEVNMLMYILNKIMKYERNHVIKVLCAVTYTGNLINYSEFVKCALRAVLKASIVVWSITLAGIKFQSETVLAIKLFLYILLLLARAINFLG